MPRDFLHNHPQFADLIRIVAEEKGIDPALVEKDYWIMHCLYGLDELGFIFQLKGGTSLSKGHKIISRFSEDIDILIEPFPGQDVKTGKNQNKPAHIQSRKDFYDWLAGEIKIDGISNVERDTEFDDVRKRPKHRRRGGDLDLYYRWDRGPILEVDCDVGTITVWNATRETGPSPNGLKVDNRVRVTCRFKNPHNLDETLRVRHQLMVLFELAAQGRQNVEDITLQHEDMPEGAQLSFVASSEEREHVDSLMPTDALLNGGLHEDDFSRVLVAWLNSARERSAARRRFIDG